MVDDSNSYRRAHAPQVRYVAPELSYMEMYNMYKESPLYAEPNAACGYEVYRKVGLIIWLCYKFMFI